MTQDASQQLQKMMVNKEKLIYSPPTVTFIGTMQDVKAKNIGISEQICGCGVFS